MADAKFSCIHISAGPKHLGLLRLITTINLSLVLLTPKDKRKLQIQFYRSDLTFRVSEFPLSLLITMCPVLSLITSAHQVAVAVAGASISCYATFS